jgi:hypothetical protein
LNRGPWGIADFNLKDPMGIAKDLSPLPRDPKDIAVITRDPVGLAVDLKNSISKLEFLE